jgi:hypothetical protein
MLKSRLASLDQFRGYTVAGMCLVNFLAPFAAIHSVLKHNETYFSYADSIMPGFLFVVGFAFRLTYLKRRRESGRLRTASSYLRRSGKLLLLSLLIYAFVGDLPRWFQFREMPPEFQSFRAQPPRTKSFDLLVEGARGKGTSDFGELPAGLTSASSAEPSLRVEDSRAASSVEPRGASETEAPLGNPTPDSPVATGQRALIAAASRIGELIKEHEPQAPTAKRKYAIAKEAAERALAEGQSFVPAAVARLRAWRELGWQNRLLIHWRILAAKLIKSDLWETLAIIAATQLVVLPWIGCRFWTRFVILLALGITHGLLSYWFNWDFLYGVNGNWMSKAWMTGDDRGWDGGIFGPLCWGIALTGGTLAYDLVAASAAHAVAVRKLVLWGAAFMAAGYAMSCLTRLYEFSGPELAVMRERRLRQDAEQVWLVNVIERQQAVLNDRRRQLDATTPADRKEIDFEIDRLQATISVLEDQRRTYPDLDLAESPVLPPWERLQGRSAAALLAEPPFVAPPADDPRIDPPPCIEHRPRNYWMLGKRMPNVSFMTFATGFDFAVFGLFIAACDIGGLRLGLFRTFGTNPLAAYFIHGAVGLTLALLMPHHVPLVFCLTSFAVAFSLTYLLVRLLEKRGIYWRL